ncbi:MAG: hypothetical protein HYV15_04155, partial [Elusimicrobia bacterium]|nr:hypothetical protein [Elusimicrobiota bacterium]
SGIANWTKGPPPPITFEDGYRYEGTGRAADYAGNVETALSTHTFIIDLSSPISRIASPPSNGFVNASLTQILGTADDRYCYLIAESEANCPGTNGRDYQAGLSSSVVEVAVQEVFGTNQYWNGTGFFSGVPVWSSATLVGVTSGSWSWNFSAANLTSPRQYKVSTRITQDRAGNYRTTYATNTFIFDTTKPLSLSTGPTGSVGAADFIFGTASDPAPGALDVVVLSIQEDQCGGSQCHSGAFWHGNIPGWQSGEVFLASGVVSGDPAVGNLDPFCDAGETCPWTFDASGVAWDNKSTYTVVARARDVAGNIKDIPGIRELTFYLETPAPVITVIAPPAAGGLPHYKGGDSAVTALNGQGNNLRLTEGVRIKLRRLTEPTSYWSDATASWINDASTYTPVNVINTVPQTWNKNLSAPYLVTNASYSMTLVGVNSANQESNPPTSRNFIIDDVKPIGLYTSPPAAACPGEPGADACITALPAIIGTAIDPGNPAGVAASITDVWVRLQDNQAIPANKFWNNTAFGPIGSESDIITSTNSAGVVNWSTATLAEPALLDGVDYTLFMFGRDKAGNKESDPAQMRQFTFVWDRMPPESGFIFPSSGTVYMNLDSITGTANDPPGASAPKRSGVTGSTLRIYRPSNNTCFNGGGFGGCASGTSDLAVTGTDNWLYQNAGLSGSLANGTTYVLWVQATDAAGNPQGTPAAPVSSRAVHIDKNPPTAGFTIPVDGVAYKPSILDGGSAIAGTAADAEAFLYPGDPIRSDGIHSLIWYMPGNTSFYFNPIACAPSKFCSTTDAAASWATATWNGSAWAVFVDQTFWVSDKPYKALVRARDRARVSTGTVVGNLSQPGVQGRDMLDFIVDGTAPTEVIESHLNGTFIQDLAEVRGTANADLSGATSYYLRISTKAGASPESFWNGAVWTTNPTNLPVEVTGSTGAVARPLLPGPRQGGPDVGAFDQHRDAGPPRPVGDDLDPDGGAAGRLRPRPGPGDPARELERHPGRRHARRGPGPKRRRCELLACRVRRLGRLGRRYLELRHRQRHEPLDDARSRLGQQQEVHHHRARLRRGREPDGGAGGPGLLLRRQQGLLDHHRTQRLPQPARAAVRHLGDGAGRGQSARRDAHRGPPGRGGRPGDHLEQLLEGHGGWRRLRPGRDLARGFVHAFWEPGPMELPRLRRRHPALGRRHELHRQVARGGQRPGRRVARADLRLHLRPDLADDDGDRAHLRLLHPAGFHRLGLL